MPIKNLMEDIVEAAVNEILDKDILKLSAPEKYKNDIITYVLNRIPPRYFRSERGILHGKLEYESAFQQKTDIIFYIYEAIKTIKDRRSYEIEFEEKVKREKNYFLPHVMGEVLEETTFSVIPDVEVTMLYKDKPVKMMDAGWSNPYKTSRAIDGFYHFWADISKIDIKKKKKNIPFTITFNHPKFIEKSVELLLDIMFNLNTYKSHLMPVTLLQARPGADLSEIIKTS